MAPEIQQSSAVDIRLFRSSLEMDSIRSTHFQRWLDFSRRRPKTLCIQCEKLGLDKVLSEAGFEQITALLVGVAERHCGGRVVSALEGGYNLRALARSVVRHVGALNTP